MNPFHCPKKKMKKKMTLSYLIGALAHFTLEAKNIEETQVFNLFCSIEHLKYLHSSYTTLISSNPRHVSSFFPLTRMPDQISQKSQLLAFHCASSIRNPTQFFKDLTEKTLKWQFIAGLIDTVSHLEFVEEDLNFFIFGANKKILITVAEFIEIPFLIKEAVGCSTGRLGSYYKLEYSSTNILDLLGHSELTKYSKVRCAELISKIAKISDSFCRRLSCTFRLTLEDAVVPTKAHFSDVGYDLTVIKIHKQIGSKTTLFDTGIALEIPFGMYAEIVPRSSLCKSGYILSNSVGIIDRSYRGNLFVALTKVEEDKPDVQLPFCCVQLIFKKQCWTPLELQQQQNAELALQTWRGDGGFGSSTTSLEK